EFAGLPPAVLAPGIEVRGTYSQAVGGFDVKVIVAGPRPGQVREFPATKTPGPDPAAGTWRAAVVLFPGSNRLGLVLTNRWRTAESAERPEVAYRRPPVVESVQPVSATAGGTGDVVARVVGDAELPPTGLVVNGRPARTDPPRRLAAVFGLAWWELTAVAAALKAGDAG